MPEGPEIRQYTDEIEKIIKNSYLVELRFIAGRYVNEPQFKVKKKKSLPDGTLELQKSLPQKILGVNCKGKFHYWTLKNTTVWITFGMTGYFNCTKGRHSHVEFKFLKNNKINTLYFNDRRRFGTIAFKTMEQLEQKLESLGPDVLKPISNDTWLNILRSKQEKTLPWIMMNQKMISGIGNYLKCEALYISKLSPYRKIKNCSDAELLCLKRVVQKIAKESYHEGIDFQCYGQSISSKGNKVKANILEDRRTTHWDPEVQK